MRKGVPIVGDSKEWFLGKSLKTKFLNGSPQTVEGARLTEGSCPARGKKIGEGREKYQCRRKLSEIRTGQIALGENRGKQSSDPRVL